MTALQEVCLDYAVIAAGLEDRRALPEDLAHLLAGADDEPVDRNVQAGALAPAAGGWLRARRALRGLLHYQEKPIPAETSE